MIPDLLNLLTPEEREAWKTCREPRCGKGCDEYIGGFPQPTTCGLGRGHRGVCDPNDDREVSPSDLAAALTTIATLRAELRAVADLIQEVGVIGIASTMDAVVVSGQPSARDLLTWAAKAMDAWPKERQTLRDRLVMAEEREREMVIARDILRETLAEQQRAFVIGLDLAQRTADAEIAELRARLTTGIGLPLGVNDRDGNPVHVGDTLAFDGWEWSRICGAPDHIYTVKYARGVILTDGTVSDIPSFCRIVKRWDAPKESP